MNDQMRDQANEQLSTVDMVAATRERAATQNGAEHTNGVDGDRANGIDGDRASSATAQIESKTDGASAAAPLLATGDAETLRSRWREVQTQFVDEPRRCVQQADTLVAEVMQRLAEMFATERSQLEQQWDRGDEVSTEELRQALRRYRSFFERLLSV